MNHVPAHQSIFASRQIHMVMFILLSILVIAFNLILFSQRENNIRQQFYAKLTSIPGTYRQTTATINKKELDNTILHVRVYSIVVSTLTIILIWMLLDLYSRKKSLESLKRLYLAEDEIKRQRDRAEQYLDTVEAIIVALDRNGTITMINRKGCTILGYREEELIGKNWFATCLPPSVGMDIVFPEFKKIISGDIKELEYYENAVITRTGKTRHIAWHNNLIKDSNGFITGTLSAGEDITEKKLAQEELITEKERLAVTLRSIGDAVIATDINGKVVLMNRAAEKLTGWNYIEARGKSLPEIFTTFNVFSRLPCENPVDKVLKTGSVVTMEDDTLLITRDGNEILITDCGAPISDRDNIITGVVLVFRDTTEKHRSEKALQKAAQLESLGVLAGGIAHDFNNLLGGIFGYLDLTRECIQTESDASNYLDKAFSVFNRAKNLTGQLLTFSKGGAPAKKTQFLPPFIRNTVQFILSGSTIKPLYFLADDMYLCDIDENQMGQVLDNIVINARDAMPDGGTITVSAENVSSDTPLPPLLPPGSYVRISIRDQGKGISPEHLEHLFDPFFTTKNKGNGLGLAISYSIVKRHNGTIEVESTPGKGTVFHIYLPVSIHDISFIPEDTTTFCCTCHGDGKVLIMDDEEYILEIASKILESIGYDVYTVSSGEEAVSKTREANDDGHPFVLALLDLTIPGGKGGIKTNEELKKICPEIKAIASSGYSDDPVMAHPKECGFDASVRKPYIKEELVHAVEMVMTHHIVDTKP